MHDILLIDSPDDAELIKQTLKQARVTNPVVQISHGADAEQYIASIENASETGGRPAPSVLLLDLELPGLDGLDLLTQPDVRKVLQKTLRIVLTGVDQTVLIKKAYAAGAHSFLTKPIQLSELRELIH